MKTTASDGSRRISAADVYAKASVPLSVPVRELDTLECIALGFTMEMLTLEDGHGFGGAVFTGAGLRSEAIQLEWGPKGERHHAVIRGSELLKAWVASFAPEEAARFPI